MLRFSLCRQLPFESVFEIALLFVQVILVSGLEFGLRRNLFDRVWLGFFECLSVAMQEVLELECLPAHCLKLKLPASFA